MTRSIVTVLSMFLTTQALAQTELAADAPRVDQGALLTLELRALDSKLEQLELRESKGRIIKGFGVGSLGVATASFAVFAVGSMVNVANALGRAVVDGLFAVGGLGSSSSGTSFSRRDPDYTPFLAVAITGLVVGLVLTVAGAVVGHTDDDEKDRFLARREQQEFVQRVNLEISRREEAAVERVSPPDITADPVPITPVEPMRKPLRAHAP